MMLSSSKRPDELRADLRGLLDLALTVFQQVCFRA